MTVTRPVDTQTRVVTRRIVQYVLDLFLIGLLLWLVARLANVIAPGAGFHPSPGRTSAIYRLDALPGTPSSVALATTVVAWLVVFVVVPIWSGRTPAMALLGLRIVRADAERATSGQHLLRAVLLVVDTIGAGFLGWLVMLCSRRRQRVGDHAAGTLVVRS